MPSLSDTLNSNKKLVRGPNGELTEQTPEEIQSLAGKAGLSSPPITPLGAGMIGANPHQQKMAGTPNQKQAAISIATNQPGESLSDAIRRGQGQERSTATEQEQTAQGKAKDLQSLGGLGDRVNSFIDAQRQKLQAANQPVEVQAQTQFNGRDVSQLKPILDQLRQNPQDMNLQLQVNQALGYDAKTQLSPDQINGLYQGATEAIAQGTAGNVDNDLTVTDLINQGDFGYDLPTLSHLLEVPEEQLAGMTVGQIRGQVDTLRNQEFSTADQNQQKAGSTELGAAERAVARQTGREMARVGTRSSEADVQHLDQQIQNADIVQFGGKQYKVDDLLQDDTISGIVSEYLNAAPGSEQRKQLEQTEPGLIQFIQKNQAILQDAANSLSQGAQGFQDIQSFNKQLGSKLPENLSKLIVPEAGSLQAQKVDVSQKPLLHAIEQDPRIASKLQGIDDKDAQTLSGVDESTIQSLEIGKQGGKWDKYQQDKIHNEELLNKATTVNPQDQDAILNLVFGGNYHGDIQDIDHIYAKNTRANVLGLPNSAGDFNALDPNHDGHVESPGALLEMYKSGLGDYSLSDAIQNRKPGDPTMKFPNDGEDSWDKDQQNLFSKLQGAAEDGKITRDEYYKSKLSSDDLMSMNWNSPAVQQNPMWLAQAISDKASDEVESKYDLRTPKGLQDAIKDLSRTQDSLSTQFMNHGIGRESLKDGSVLGREVSNLQNKLSQMKSKEEASSKKEAESNKQKATTSLVSQLDQTLNKSYTSGQKSANLSISADKNGVITLTDKTGKVVAKGSTPKDFAFYLGGK